MTGISSPILDDTIVAVSSAPGPGRRAIVRVTGPGTREIVETVFSPDAHAPLRVAATLKTGFLRLSGVRSPLPCDLYFWKSPRTYTGQDLAELHTISSPPLVERLVADLLATGARSAKPGEFTMRAFLSGKKDLPQAEAVLAVIEAGTDADLTAALGQLAGGVSRPLDRVRDDLLNLLADVEAGLDFVEEDIHFVSKSEILRRLHAGLDQLATLRRQLDDRSVSGRPIRIAIVGQPNAGKSSLFNALIGNAAAIVSPTSGTTRDYLTQRLSLGGCEVELIDTAGWSESAETIEARAQRLGTEQSERADVLLWCVPATEPVSEEDRERLRKWGSEIMLVRTKADLEHFQIHRGAIVSRTRKRRSFFPSLVRPANKNESAISVSVTTNEGMNELKTAIAERVNSIARPALAPSLSRCRHHVDEATEALNRGVSVCEKDEPNELLALELRSALEQIGEMTGTIYTNDLLDRVFGRFCIGK